MQGTGDNSEKSAFEPVPEHDHAHVYLEDGTDLEPDDNLDLESLENHPIWLQENVTLKSVGIDIGSSGTQVVFSELKLKRDGSGLKTRYIVVERNLLFQSEVRFTPFTDGLIINSEALGEIIDEAYGKAQILPKSIDTGIVILTGEALRRENAQSIAMIISEKAGDFVCATAGHHMEATLAAYGSGAVQVSADLNQQILNIDIGGGTTKLSLVDNGKILSTAALHVGGRLIVTDPDGKITRLEDAAIQHGREIGMKLELGEIVTSYELDHLANHMVEQLVASLVGKEQPTGHRLPYLTDPIPDLGSVDGVVFSGGVGEYVYRTEKRDFGDLGRRIGDSLRRKLSDGSIPFKLLPASARIRATALGASEFCVQLSGNTCYLTDAQKILPKRNIQVVHPQFTLDDEIDVDQVSSAIRGHVEAFTTPENDNEIVVALNWSGELSYLRLKSMAQAIVSGLEKRIKAGYSLLLTFDADLAKSLGSMLRDEFKVANNILVVDGITLWDFDYIDLGRPLVPSLAIPVTIKSLVF